MNHVPLVLLCLVLPLLAVLLRDGASLKVLRTFPLRPCGRVPGVVYDDYRVVPD